MFTGASLPATSAFFWATDEPASCKPGLFYVVMEKIFVLMRPELALYVVSSLGYEHMVSSNLQTSSILSNFRGLVQVG